MAARNFKISDQIRMLQAIQAEHGDLLCFDANVRPITHIDVEHAAGNYPKDWNMPEKFVLLGEPD